MARRITRKEIRARVHKAWGKDLNNQVAVLGFFEGSKDEATESGLHEFCHTFTLGLTPKRGAMKFEDVEDKIKALPWSYQRDLQEVRAIAAELILIKRLRLDLCPNSLKSFGHSNMEKDWDRDRFFKAVDTALRTKSARRVAKQVQEFLGISNRELYGYRDHI